MMINFSEDTIQNQFKEHGLPKEAVTTAYKIPILKIDRPRVKQRMIERKDPEIRSGYSTGFLYIGNSTSDYTYPILRGFSITQLTKFLIEKNPANALLKVLDLGSGESALIEKWNNEFPEKMSCSGITAYISELRKEKVSQWVHVDNLEMMPPYGSEMDIVLSKLAFCHLIDAARALMKAYAALAPNGILLIDKFSLPGIEKNYHLLERYLAFKGYEFTMIYNANQITFFAIKKTLPTLDLPFIDNGYDYVMDERSLSELEGLENIKPIAFLPTQDIGGETTFESILEDKNFLEKKPEEQWHILIDLASKISHQQESDLLDFIKSNPALFDFYSVINDSCTALEKTLDAFTYKGGKTFYKFTKAERLALIKILAIADYKNYSEIKRTIQGLKKLGFPEECFYFEKISSHYPECRVKLVNANPTPSASFPRFDFGFEQKQKIPQQKELFPYSIEP